MQNLPQRQLTEDYVKPISRGQITIPVAYRQAYGIDENTWIRIEPGQGRIVLIPEKKTGERQVVTIIPPKVSSERYKEMLEKMKGGWWSLKDEQARLAEREKTEKRLKQIDNLWQKQEK